MRHKPVKEPGRGFVEDCGDEVEEGLDKDEHSRQMALGSSETDCLVFKGGQPPIV